LIVAIDGPAGSGKSTTAQLVAKELGYLYIDTGAMYRAVTLQAQNSGVDLKDDNALSDIAREAVIELRRADRSLSVSVDGQDVTDAIRLPDVDRDVSRVSEVEGVRDALVAQQQRLGVKGGVVMEGRDIGTVVFPDAEIKVYLVASEEERARRRRQQLKDRGIEVSVDEVLSQIKSRDKANMERDHGPLRPADDARHLDTTGISIEEQVATLVAWVQNVESDLAP
jgi:cytidylate kinase